MASFGLRVVCQQCRCHQLNRIKGSKHLSSITYSHRYEGLYSVKEFLCSSVSVMFIVVSLTVMRALTFGLWWRVVSVAIIYHILFLLNDMISHLTCRSSGFPDCSFLDLGILFFESWDLNLFRLMILCY